ncbi:hypothetical protein M426DRAFT_225408 [Hypoxylon sp. CI-4A]|nr:hypothetical protein M426DRAFT_225408 [Hypoxylon sp. CI-4A]
MEANSQMDRRKPKRRTANACIACRQSKIKCSGEDPCQNCKRRAIRCQFTEGGNKVVVSEKYLQSLQRQLEERQRSPSSTNLGSPTQTVASSFVLGHAAQPQAIDRDEPTHGRRSFTNASSRLHGDTNGEPRGDTGLVSPTVNALDASQQPEASYPILTPTSQPTEPCFRVWSNPFIIPSKVIKNTCKNKRTWIWLAPWSTWSFTMRLILMVREKIHPEDPSIPPNLIDTEAYTWTYKTSSSDLCDVTGLPSLDHAIYLLNTVKFHLGQTYHLFDGAEIEQQIRDFYSNGNGLQVVVESRLWFVKFLIILAFGIAFQGSPTPNQEPPGAKFFTRAMSLLPDPTELWKSSLLAIETLALIALYLFSIDSRESAHIYHGHALRIALLEGLHTQLPEHELGTTMTNNCRNLWWTLYLMDRHFSSSVGLPMSVQDSDITTPISPPNPGSRADSFRSLQVNLSHLLSVILTTVYKPNITPLDAFLEQTRTILHTLAHHAQEIEKIISLLQNSVGSMPRDTRHLTLMYHQCVIVATRPLLLSVLKERVDTRDEDCEDFLAQTGTVIRTGIKSATKTLQIITSEYSLLEAFLPYDIEFCYGAALHLIMANALFPDVEDYQSFLQLAHQILDSLILRGNRVAHARKSELTHLELLFNELAVQTQQHQMLHLFYPEAASSDTTRKEVQDGERSMAESSALAMGSDVGRSLHPPMTGTNMEFLDTIGISSEEFLSIVQEIGSTESPEDIMTLV